MIKIKGMPEVMARITKDPRILKIIQDNPELNMNLVSDLYKKQWTEIAKFLRQKKGVSFQVPGLGSFVFHINSSPLFLAIKYKALDNLTLLFDVYEKNDHVYEEIRTTEYAINQSKSIIFEFYEKQPIQAARFQKYWQEQFLLTKRNFLYARYLRRALEDINIYFSDEEYERRYQAQKELVFGLSESGEVSGDD